MIARLLLLGLVIGVVWVGQRLIVASQLVEPLFVATRRGDQTTVRALLARGANPNLLFHSGGLTGWLSTRSAAPIHAAVRNGDIEMVRLLLDSGADPNGTDGYARPALQRAAGLGERAIVELLLDRGADVNLGNCDHATALMAAAAGGHVEIVKLLLAGGARVSVKDTYSSQTALSCAAKRADGPHQEIVRLLIQAGATATRGWALGYAVQNRDVGTARLLLLYGGDPNGRVDLLVNPLGGGPNTSTKVGMPLLTWSAAHGDFKTAVELVKRGADVNFRDGFGDTPLSVARANDDEAMVQLLIRAGAR